MGLRGRKLFTASILRRGLLLQCLDLFRYFRFGPIFVVFFPGLAANIRTCERRGRIVGPQATRLPLH
jgi:hypothetical protein